MKWKFRKPYISLNFQQRESPALLNISTTEPDRDGPVACLSGPVAFNTFLINRLFMAGAWLGTQP